MGNRRRADLERVCATQTTRPVGIVQQGVRHQSECASQRPELGRLDPTQPPRRAGTDFPPSPERVARSFAPSLP